MRAPQKTSKERSRLAQSTSSINTIYQFTVMASWRTGTKTRPLFKGMFRNTQQFITKMSSVWSKMNFLPNLTHYFSAIIQLTLICCASFYNTTNDSSPRFLPGPQKVS